ncbi:MAG: NAD(P)H-binding protein [Chitinivibrionales bacterium]|nr:NAD(P)H-binding protein [Chitinivibrionales bacterium]MBD3355599.1 NAD(P)H-binding protein [Chitinivibrionales bacterium]
MIAITGATGHVGGMVMSNLLNGGVQARELTAVVRNRDKAQWIAERGVEIRFADYDKPESLPQAFEGVETLLFISSSSRDDRQRIVQHRAVVEAAAKAQVKHIVYTSFIDAHPPSPFHGAEVHQVTERLIMDGGMGWTLLRNGAYTDFLLMMSGPAIERGALTTASRVGHVSYVAREDIARAASAVLREPAGHDRKVYVLTGPESLSQEDIAGVLSRVSAKNVEYRLVSEHEYVKHMANAMNMPVEAAAGFLGMTRAIEIGRMSYISDDVEILTGRPAQRVEEFLRRAQAAGSPHA